MVNEANRGCGAPGIARSCPKYRLLAPDHRCNEETAARRDAAELKPAPLTGGDARTPTQRATKKMTLTTAALGSLSGLFIGVFSNGVRKLPLFRRPWDHLILMGIMGYGGHKYPQLEDATLERVNAMRAARKLGPLDKNVWGLAVSKQEASQNKD